MMLKLLLIAIAPTIVDSARISSSFQRLRQKLSPSPGDVLDSLDEYDKFWVEVAPKSCVWSECSIDDTDDAYMGDNRDGDEQWYQYRTQSFCANAAYSLYGRKKNGGFSVRGCSRKHYINSYFTYGGADNLLMAIGKDPVVFYGSDGYTTSNADCVDASNNGGNSGDGGGRNVRRLSSGDNDGDYRSSSLGCDSEGNYIMCEFQSNSCDGNYFVGALDKFDDYNEQYQGIGCHAIWKRSRDSGDDNSGALYDLLSNSWTCDVPLYPNSCRDPYGKKAQYDYAVRTAAHGGNPMLAYMNTQLRRPLRTFSWVLLVLSVLILCISHYIKNRKRSKAGAASPSALGGNRDASGGNDKSNNMKEDDGGHENKMSSHEESSGTPSSGSSPRRSPWISPLKSLSGRKRSILDQVKRGRSTWNTVTVKEEGTKEVLL